MFFLIEKQTDRVDYDNEGYQGIWAVRQNGTLAFSAWLFWVAAVLAPIPIAIVFHPAWLLLWCLVAVTACIFGAEEQFPVDHKGLILYRPKRSYLISTDISSDWWDDDVKQRALRDMCDEWDEYGDKFDIYDWKTEFRSLDKALEEKFNIEKETYKMLANRPKYAQLVRETNNILKKGMEDL